jgi:alpha-tubulin suppressor-like RCC1 family protein
MALYLARLGRTTFVSVAAAGVGASMLYACDAPMETQPPTTETSTSTTTDSVTVATATVSTTGTGGAGGATGAGGTAGVGGAGGSGPICMGGETACGDVCVDTATDLQHCGGCDTVCGPLDHGMPACTMSACAVGACDSGFDDCDKDVTTGCEAEFAVDTKNCGACGNACGTGQLCVSGECQTPVVASNIATGFEHSCVVLMDGTAKCWGDNGSGELGNAANVMQTSPVGVSNATSLSGAAAGVSFGCARKSDGTVWCWGSNGNGGKLGDGTGVSSNVPVQVKGLTGAETIAAGRGHACASTTAKEVYCWGTNTFGQLGDPAKGSSNVPVKVPAGLPAARAISIAAGGFHTCAVFEGGDVYCWGKNDNGQIGTGMTSDKETSPLKVTLPKAAAEVVAGDLFTCARLIDGSVYCWGFGPYGQLGNSASASSSVPVSVTGIATAIDLGAGFDHACAVLADNTVTCWGFNSNKQLGNTNGNSNKPVAVAGLTGAAQVEGGNAHSCAFLLTGGVRCWGANAKGQLGNASTVESGTPVVPVGLD